MDEGPSRTGSAVIALGITANREVAGGSPPAEAGPVDAVGLVHELSEALTAVGNYLMAAHRQSLDQPQSAPGSLSDALAKGLGQYDRACVTTRELRAHLARIAKGRESLELASNE